MVTVGFIDPFTSPDSISAGLKQHAIKSIAIFQRKFLADPHLQKRALTHLFDEVIYVEPEDEIETIVAKLKQCGVDFLFNGFDQSNEFTDRVASQFHPELANNAETSHYRHNKLAGQKILSETGTQTTKQLDIKGNSLSPQDEAVLATWQFPVVMKPVNAGGSIGYIECNTLAEVKNRLATVPSHFHNIPIPAHIIQEKLIGIEYAVDTFSLKGEHHVIHIRRYQKKYFNGTPIAKQADTVLPTAPEWNTLVAHCLKTLNAIEFNNGFCHTEIFSTDKGLFSIDINPRLPGARNSSCLLTRETYGHSHMDILSHVVLNKPLQTKNYQHGRTLFLQNTVERIIDDVKIDKIKHLPSFKHCVSNSIKGTLRSSPKNVLDTIAFIVLAHPDLQQLDADSAEIFALEKQLELY